MNSDISTASDTAVAGDEEQAPATPKSTREAIVRSTGSGYTLVRHAFVQKHQGRKRGSTLGRLVRERKRRELILYLLVLTAWEGQEGRSPWSAAVWLRALEVKPAPNLTWSRSSLSETWTELVRLKMIERSRQQRRSRITPRREDRKGVYVRPDGKTVAERYFNLPGEFWTDLWFDRLGLAGIAVLLILLKETNKEPEVHLTHADTAQWYGISESTAKKGYKELVDAGLVTFRDDHRRANFSETGLTTVRYYSLTGPFSTDARADARALARRERSRRLRSAKASSTTRANRVTPERRSS